VNTVFLIGNQPVLIYGFRQVLSHNGFDVCGHCASHELDLAPVSSGPAAGGTGDAERPSLILVDATNGIEFPVLEEVRSRAPGCSIILWTDSLPLNLVFRTLEFGVRGVVERNSRPEQLVDALRRVSEGEMQIGFPTSTPGGPPKKQVSVTPREREIIDLLRQGMRNKQIATEMGITEGTVKIYLFRLFHKLGVRNRFDLARLNPEPAAAPVRTRHTMRAVLA
jgi:two-component system nitrate/nitrite response regulator NarP